MPKAVIRSGKRYRVVLIVGMCDERDDDRYDVAPPTSAIKEFIETRVTPVDEIDGETWVYTNEAIETVWCREPHIEVESISEE